MPAAPAPRTDEGGSLAGDRIACSPTTTSLDAFDHGAVAVFADKVAERGRRGLLGMEQACFSSVDPRLIWQRVAELVERVIGVMPIGIFHYSVSIGAVLGLELADNRRIALKVFAPWHSSTFLAAAAHVRHVLARDGYPAPAALSGVEPFGMAHAWAEEWVRAPAAAPATEVVAPLARHLADFLERCSCIEADPALGGSWQTYERPVGIWRNPPRPDADLTVDVPDAEWVLEIAESGRALAEAAPGPKVIGHIDWRPDNVRIDTEGTLAAVFDWDSVQLTHRVHVLAGACTAMSPEDVGRFLDRYEHHAGVRLATEERAAVAGRVIWSRAIWARYELVRRLPESELRFVPRLISDVGDYLQAATTAG